jgi:phage terminase large subunit-like protein
MFPHTRLQEFKTTWGTNYFSSEYLCNPIVGENCPIKEEQIRTWTELPKQYSCVIAVDPAYSEDASADYKVASVVAIDQAGNRYLLDYIRTHDSIGEFQDQIINLYRQNRTFLTSVGIPNSGVEKAFFDSFANKCMEQKVAMPIIELKNAFTRSGSGTTIRNKTMRVIAALQPLFQQGRYYIAPHHMEAREELLTIGSSKNDDIVDTLAYAEQILQPIYYETMAAGEEQERDDRGIDGYGSTY